MDMLIAAAVVFLALHLLIAGTKLRDAITGILGERAYLMLFSLASIAAIIWMALSYNAAQLGQNPQLYALGPHVTHLGIPVILIAFWLGVQGLFMANPTSVQQERAATKNGVVTGVLRITRHPFLWGVVIWAAFHLAANGDQASVIFFGTFFVLALLGTFFIDAKRKRKMGKAWDGFAAKTSNIPFGAVLTGRTKLKLSESFGWRFWVTLVIFAAVLLAHAHLFGVSPFPGGYVPV